ncbi:MAG TPA: nuclear transport factor 2 family protein [Ferruginibacter sp.]|mgnify:CR=1 FL=1|nr:nuclear transport factor 2 family protein [Ferruginibacter sp.]
MIKTNKLLYYFLLILLTALSTSCSRKPDLEKEKKKLLHLHTQQQQAHLYKNAKQFVSQFAENMLSVNGGKIAVSVKDSALKKFQNYFNQVAFSKWEDVTPPVIEFSADASMAYMVVDKRVVLTYKNEENKLMEETTHFAWVSVFRKQSDGEWRIICNITTNEPALTKPIL